MAWIVGLLTDTEADALDKRGWDVRIAPPEVREHLATLTEEDEHGDEVEVAEAGRTCVHCGRNDRIRACVVYVDCDVFALMSGPGWVTGPDKCKNEEELCRYKHRTQLVRKKTGKKKAGT